jgi:hypothetical protein
VSRTVFFGQGASGGLVCAGRRRWSHRSSCWGAVLGVGLAVHGASQPVAAPDPRLRRSGYRGFFAFVGSRRMVGSGGSDGAGR